MPFGYLVATYEYSPYGETTTTGLGQFNPFRYLSAWQETNAAGDPGHYKLGARFFNTNGMFTQPDALSGNLGDPRTMTSYNYAGGDPINQSDPKGTYFGESVVEAGKDAADEVGDFTKTFSGCFATAALATFSVAGTIVTGFGIVASAPVTLGGSLAATGFFTASVAASAISVGVAAETCF